MNFKVGGSVPMPGVSRYKNVQKAEPKPAVRPEETDKVDVSESARSFSAALRAVKEVPEMRMDKVKELQDRIQNGDYQVNSRELAEKILSEVK